jgi:hypothetical protein
MMMQILKNNLGWLAVSTFDKSAQQGKVGTFFLVHGSKN